MNGYGLGDTVKIAINLIYTRIFWKNARLVRRPILARNKKNIHISEGFTCGTLCRLNADENGSITIGRNFVMGDQCQIEAMNEVVIGEDVLFASRVYIGDATHGEYKGADQADPKEAPNKRKVTAEPIHIGDRVWIGNGVAVLGGVTIGDGAVIGANAVVTSNIPSDSIAAGCPARVIKKYNEESRSWEAV